MQDGREGDGVEKSGAERTPRQPSDQSPTNCIARIRAARGVEPEREPERIMLESGEERRSQMVENCVNLKAGRKAGSPQWGKTQKLQVGGCRSSKFMATCLSTDADSDSGDGIFDQGAGGRAGGREKGREQVRTRTGRPEEQEDGGGGAGVESQAKI